MTMILEMSPLYSNYMKRAAQNAETGTEIY
jgi:hypothetical protein